MTSHSYKQGLWTTNRERRAVALVERRNTIIGELRFEGFTVTEISKLFNMHKASVSRIARFGTNKLKNKIYGSKSK